VTARLGDTLDVSARHQPGSAVRRHCSGLIRHVEQGSRRLSIGRSPSAVRRCDVPGDREVAAGEDQDTCFAGMATFRSERHETQPSSIQPGSLRRPRSAVRAPSALRGSAERSPEAKRLQLVQLAVATMSALRVGCCFEQRVRGRRSVLTSSPLFSRARRSLPLRRWSAPSARIRPARGHPRRGSPCH
jgi:hypothetical protein